MARTTSQRARRRRGFFLTDSIVGFMLIGMLGLALVVAVTTASKAKRRLDDSAGAATAAEQVMAMLRDGKAAPQSIGEASVAVRAAQGGAAVAGQRWVEVIVKRNGRTASLVGLVPEGGPR